VSIKERHELSMWYAALEKLQFARNVSAGQSAGVSAGEAARYMGVTRVTAQKRLRRLVAEGAAIAKQYVEKNGVTGVKYYVE